MVTIAVTAEDAPETRVAASPLVRNGTMSGDRGVVASTCSCTSRPVLSIVANESGPVRTNSPGMAPRSTRPSSAPLVGGLLPPDSAAWLV